MVVILGPNWDPNNAQLYSVPIIDAKSWDLFTTVIGFAPADPGHLLDLHSRSNIPLWTT